jgi:superfamily II RNA helicase
MVVICDKAYTDKTGEFQKYFDLFEYELSDFQKYSIEAIVSGHHSLVTAHTGSGKSLPAEFAIQHFIGLGKKVVYTSPIKALSNQKYYDFIQKYPHISFGLITGDIKLNPDADVLIMTTEILMNKLFQMGDADADAVTETHTEAKLATTPRGPSVTSTLDFQMDIQNELACVIFDEIHYINDASRGHVWEQTILMLPPQIQMVMLSATIDSPEKFAKWCERGMTEKQVYLSTNLIRVVPLIHYGYLITNESVFKKIRDKETQQKIREKTNTLIELKTESGKFMDTGYYELKKYKDLFEQNQIFMKRSHVLNQLAKHLCEKEMLPAIAFVFSRKNVELCAKEITVPLLEFDSKVPYIVRRECEQIVRKLPNYEEYLALPEYNQLVELLEKGVGIHHSGMIPILREIVELMISKKYIKLLFATESFAIGLNCPIRTAIFTTLTKFDGNEHRYLLPHEYNQAAGRAGRRGIDTIGYVVHCNNLFDFPYANEYRDILCGSPQTLISKFNISFSVVLNLLQNGKTKMSDFVDFVGKSMVQNEIHIEKEGQIKTVENMEEEYKKKKESIQYSRTPLDICREYSDLKQKVGSLVNKKRKETERKLTSLSDQYKTIEKDSLAFDSLIELENNLKKEREVLEGYDVYIHKNIKEICDMMVQNRFIQEKGEKHGEKEYEFTCRGKMASGFAEVQPLVFAECLEKWDNLVGFSPQQIVGLLSCFTGLKVKEDIRACVPNPKDIFLKARTTELKTIFERYLDIGIGEKTEELVFDIIDMSQKWCDCESEMECKMFIQENLVEKEISIGDFIKAILKISTIVKEIMRTCEKNNMVDLLHKVSQIDAMILKYIATTQSLYL